MVDKHTFRRLALQLQEVTEQPHFQKVSFRFGKKIVATLNEKEEKAVLKLSEIDQSVYCTLDPATISPVPGTWGKQGWTTVDLKTITQSILAEMLQKAHQHVAFRPKRKNSKF